MRDLFFWDIESAGKWKTYNHIDDPKATYIKGIINTTK